MKKLSELIKKKILIIDGAMGTMIQTFKLKDEDYRGVKFKNHPIELKGLNDLLCITKPQLFNKFIRIS